MPPISNFDPQNLLNDAADAGYDTKYTPVPAGGPYAAIISKVNAKQYDSKQVEGEKSTVLEVTFEIDDASVKEATGMEKPTAKMSVFLELDAAGKIAKAKGKNVQYGRLLESMGLNDPNRKVSPADLMGRAAVIEIVHTPNPKYVDDRSQPPVYANVSKVARP